MQESVKTQTVKPPLKNLNDKSAKKYKLINNFKLLSIYENKIKFIDNNLLLTFKGGNTNNYDKEYNNDTGKYNIIINNNQYYYNVEQYSFYDEKCIEDKQFKFINLITTKL